MDADKDVERNNTDAEETHSNKFTRESIEAMRPAIESMADARREHKDSQEDIAGKLHVTVDYIGKIEQNRAKLPAYVMQKYCQEYNLSADDLLALARPKEEKDEIWNITRVIKRLPEPYLKAVNDIIDLYWADQ